MAQCNLNVWNARGRTDAASGHTTVSAGETVTWLVLSRYGAGRTAALAMKCADRRVIDHASYIALWLALLDHVILNKTVTGAMRDLPVEGGEEAHAEDALRIAAGLRIPSRSAVVTYLVLYLFVAVIVNYIVFKRLKRLEYGWVAMVVLAVAFFIGTTHMGIASREIGPEVHELELVRTQPGSDFARRIGYDGIASQKGLDLDVLFGGAGVLRGLPGATPAVHLSEVRSGLGLLVGAGRDTLQVMIDGSDGSGQHVRNLHIPPAGMRVFRRESIEPIEETITADVRCSKGVITGEIVLDEASRLMDALDESEEAFLCYGGLLFRLHRKDNAFQVGRHYSSLRDGVMAQYVKRNDYEEMFKSDAERLTTAKNMLAGELFYGAGLRELSRLESMLSRFLKYVDSPTWLRMGSYEKRDLDNFWLHWAYFCGWIRNDDISIHVGRELSQTQSWSLLVVEIPVKLDPRDKSFQEEYLYKEQPFALTIGDGDGARTYHSFVPERRRYHIVGGFPIPLEARAGSSAAFQSLSMTFEGGLNVSHLASLKGILLGTGFRERDIEMYAYNHVTSQWDRIELMVAEDADDDEQFGFFEVHRLEEYYDSSEKRVLLRMAAKRDGLKGRPPYVNRLSLQFFMDAASQFEAARSYFQ
jgi:hypothetical protein